MAIELNFWHFVHLIKIRIALIYKILLKINTEIDEETFTKIINRRGSSKCVNILKLGNFDKKSVSFKNL